MRWLLLKDVQILRRSPLLVGLLLAYAVLMSVLLIAATKGGQGKPKVAFANLVEPGKSSFSVGGESFDAADYANRLFTAIDPLRVRTREEALAKVRDGEALAALVIPADAVQRLQSAINLSGGGKAPTLDVYYNAEDPVKERLVRQTIDSQLLRANKELTERITEVAAGYLDILLRGGGFEVFGRKIDVLGLQRSADVIRGVRAALGRGSPEAAGLEPVERFARLAIDNLDVSGSVLGSIGEPVAIKQVALDGAREPIDRYTVALAIMLSLGLVSLLLGSALLALEREENAFARLVRGLVSRTALLVEKVALTGALAGLMGLLVLVAVGAVLGFDFARVPLWIVALAFAALAFGAMGTTIGALAREIRSASLLALLLALPLAVLAAIPSGVINDTLFDLVRIVSAVFPFRPSLQALDRAISGGDALLGPLLHLAALTVGFTALARVSIRRFG